MKVIRKPHGWQVAQFELKARFHGTTPRTVRPTFGAERAAHPRAQLTDGTSSLTGADLSVLDEALHLLETLPAQRAQHSHLDFTSRNVLWDTEAEAGVIDFETSRYEAVGQDFLRITRRTLHHRPELRTAFYRGYGREPDWAESELMRICTVTDAAAATTATATATARGQYAFATEARGILTAAVRAWARPSAGNRHSARTETLMTPRHAHHLEPGPRVCVVGPSRRPSLGGPAPSVRVEKECEGNRSPHGAGPRCRS
ncbi:phosphotransferase [Streptomyces scabiei]|uniref:phosphotransferase n=1 Tax=Streptomyces scabiei TaxID=1930 RepID=UPI00068A00F4|nr:phosphotransferase [Streptomyces scabiei]